MLILRPVRPEDADRLFPMIYNSPVTDTLLWDGPDSIEEYRQAMAKRAEQTARGENHMMTIAVDDDIVENAIIPIGSADIRQEPDQIQRADIGLWIGEPYHSKGYGTLTIRWLLDYGFTRLGLEKIEASVYTGNWASRRIFEKNGFSLEGTIRKATLKRGEWQDDWRLGITREDYERAFTRTPIFHICTQAAWQTAQAGGTTYKPGSLENEGFIHSSRQEQVLWVANTLFRGQPDLLLLEIDAARLRVEIRLDAAQDTFFPHIYGPLNIDAVMAARAFVPDPDGFFRKLP